MTAPSAIDQGLAPDQTTAVARMAFRRVYERTERSLHRLAWAILLDRAEAADVVQEAFVRLHRQMARLPADAHVEAWLHRVTVNLACSWRRRLVRFGRSWAAPTQRADPERQVGERQGIEVLLAALRALPPQQRAVAALHLDGGLAPFEIAEVLEITPNSARVTLHRALAKLRAALVAADINPQSLSTFTDSIASETDE